MKITLEFESKRARDNFFDWWLDGGGEQYLNFDSRDWDNKKRDYIRIEGTGSVGQNEDN